ncbi:MAG: hypothetical protein PHD00_09940 [Bacteroidales bacterium]|nr:hypothetical protein [Bacteroidales bacterium]MDD4671643.1 hypothetical protein [Bacteroidales bacterium]MDY0349371.1 hypothetical protein [Tenuifilaceae bacterium]
MNRIFPIVLLAFALVFSGCASKRLAKRGLKFEQAGMYEMAADYYYHSVVAKPSNVDAVIGLKKNGQRLLDEKLLRVQKSYFNNNDKETVHAYIDAKNYFDKIKNTGVSLSLSETTQQYYQEAKPRYLESLFYDAQLLLDEEKFKESELKFTEIKQIDPTFDGVDDLMKISKSEPLYRQGKGYLEGEMYRKAYTIFNSIVSDFGLYKDSKDLRDESLLKAQLTIAIGKVNTKITNKEAPLLVESALSSGIGNINNPFFKLVDIKNIDEFINQQRLGSSLGSEIRVGKMLVAKAIINATILKFDVSEGRIKTQNKRGYIKKTKTYEDKQTGEERKVVEYDKVSYTEVSKTNSCAISVQYQLVSTETAEVLLSDVITVRKYDVLNYADYKGNSNNLVPGYWEYSNKKSSKDRIDDNSYAVRQLQQLLKASKKIKSASQLKTEALTDFSTRITRQVGTYNPEN